jgi:hypothetical protein
MFKSFLSPMSELLGPLTSSPSSIEVNSFFGPFPALGVFSYSGTGVDPKALEPLITLPPLG